jgi:hypothetical protein
LIGFESDSKEKKRLERTGKIHESFGKTSGLDENSK